MKKLLMTIAVVMLLAGPAMAAPVHTMDVDVKLSIEAYATLRNMPTEVTINFTSSDLAGGVLGGVVGIYGDIVANVMPVVTADIVPVTGAVGTWSLDDPVVEATGDPAVWSLAVGVRVSVMPGEAPMTATKQATVTITITSPV